MSKISRRELLGLSGLVGLAAAAGCGHTRARNMMGGRMMSGSMMGSASASDMSTYMELFARHDEIRRTVQEIPGGVRTVTESDAPELTSQLQQHVASMYEHLSQRAEVTCMSESLPTLFRNATSYRRRLTTTPKGVVVTETSSDPRLIQKIREHAREVTGFVQHGMPAMMRTMMK